MKILDLSDVRVGDRIRLWLDGSDTTVDATIRRFAEKGLWVTIDQLGPDVDRFVAFRQIRRRVR